MKKIAFLLCSIMLSGWIMNSMAFIQPVYADHGTVSNGDSEELDISSGDGKGILSALSKEALKTILDDRTVMALVYLADEYPIRKDVSYDSEVVVTVPSGQQVHIQDVEMDENQQVWVFIKLTNGGTEYYGYIPRENLACSDELFLNWEEEYNVKSKKSEISAFSSNFNYIDIAEFPQSYHEPLMKLKQAHPNWTFVPMNTGLDWNTVVYNEMLNGRSLVPNSFPESMKEGPYGQQGWSYASRGALSYYLDPRNGITEDWIFQFELLTYNATYHTQDALQSYLNKPYVSYNLFKIIFVIRAKSSPFVTALSYSSYLIVVGITFLPSVYEYAQSSYEG